MPETIDLANTVFAKTPLGQEEVQSRSLGLSLLVRRALVLVDGRRSGNDLSVFLVGKGDIAQVLSELLERGCIEAVARASRSAAPPPEPVVTVDAGPGTEASGIDGPGDAIPGLPPAESRDAKENEMARNFMINSINAIIGQHTRVTLVDNIFHAQGTEGLRKIYRDWEASMANHGAGSRRLPELREKLFKVL